MRGFGSLLQGQKELWLCQVWERITAGYDLYGAASTSKCPVACVAALTLLLLYFSLFYNALFKKKDNENLGKIIIIPFHLLDIQSAGQNEREN